LAAFGVEHFTNKLAEDTMSFRDVIEALAILRGGADTMKAIRGLIVGDGRKAQDCQLMPIRGLVERHQAQSDARIGGDKRENDPAPPRPPVPDKPCCGE
jgi:hypothetical protein